MPTPIDQMINGAVKCLRCGAAMGGCDCWAKGDFVTLHCPGCKKEKQAAKDKTDPDGTATIHLECPECANGHFGGAIYLDKQGNQLLPD